MPKFLLSIFTVIWIFALPVNGQRVGISVKGKVIDSEQHPLELVNVSIKGTALGAITNSMGEFTLPPISEKSITIIFSFIGYQTSEQVVSLTGHPFVFQVLKPVLQKIQEIVVEGNLVTNNLVSIPQKLTEKLPSIAGGVERSE